MLIELDEMGAVKIEMTLRRAAHREYLAEHDTIENATCLHILLEKALIMLTILH